MRHRPLPLLDIGGSDLIAHSTDGWNQIISKLGEVRLEEGEFLQMAVLGSREDLLRVLQSSSMPSGLSDRPRQPRSDDLFVHLGEG